MKLLNLLAGVALLTSIPVLGSAQSRPPEHRISAERAERIALNKYSGRVTRKPALEHDNGRWRYDVHVTDRRGQFHVVSVDAIDGHVFNSWRSTPSNERIKERDELRAAHRDLVSSEAYRRFISHRNGDEAINLLSSPAYHDYQNAWAIVERDPNQRSIWASERSWYHTLQNRVNSARNKRYRAPVVHKFGEPIPSSGRYNGRRWMDNMGQWHEGPPPANYRNTNGRWSRVDDRGRNDKLARDREKARQKLARDRAKLERDRKKAAEKQRRDRENERRREHRGHGGGGGGGGH